MGYSHLFGPVLSRRLGRSLGVDLVPHKTCSYDCVYCEVGSTTHRTTTREEYFPPHEIEEELALFLSPTPDLDFITLSGSGEPTLSLSLGRIIRYVKSNFSSYPLAVLTNGSMLWDPAVREELIPADVILPTLSTVEEESFQKIHRPAPGLTIQKVIHGLRDFREVYKGEIWLEVFLIPGINMEREGLAALGATIRDIRPERVQLNTLDRPGTEPWVSPATHEELAEAARLMGLPGSEPIKSVVYGGPRPSCVENAAAIIRDILKRRPSTAKDLSEATGLHLHEVGKILREMSSDGKLSTCREERGIFYSWTSD